MMNAGMEDDVFQGDDIRSLQGGDVRERIGRSRRRRYMLIGAVVVVILVIIVSVSVSQNRSSSSSNPIVSLDDSSIKGIIRAALEKEGISGDVLDAAGYQKLAYEWLLTNSQVSNYDRSQILQRFTLACLYFSTYQIASVYSPTPAKWIAEEGWLTDINECEWMGLSCNAGLKVDGIDLSENGLTGKIPPEIVLIREHLHTLTMNSNELFMEDTKGEFGFLTKMSTLQNVVLDDNFLAGVNGIPRDFSSLTGLRKIRLSYNLFGGSLNNDMLSAWPKLTHLEIESNFLTGSLPPALGDMDELIYLYIRRNSMSFNLDFLKGGGMKSLFAMWLDSNEVTGTIPTEIGLASNLASLSITNCTLRGPIPTELGEIPHLQRVWLYGNDLTGQVPSQLMELSKLEVFEVQDNALVGAMPEGICTLIRTNTYDHKSLSADCNEVSCEGCCTRCYE